MLDPLQQPGERMNENLIQAAQALGKLSIIHVGAPAKPLRYVLRDCQGKVIGNPKGYAKASHANAVMARSKGSAARAAWTAYHLRQDTSKPLVWSLKLEAV
jgi:hypothetical protein